MDRIDTIKFAFTTNVPLLSYNSLTPYFSQRCALSRSDSWLRPPYPSGSSLTSLGLPPRLSPPDEEIVHVAHMSARPPQRKRSRSTPPPLRAIDRPAPVREGPSPYLDLSSSERLQKVLSRLGVTSRRGAEALMAEGRVTVNGTRVRESGTAVNVWKDQIAVDGRKVSLPRTVTWLALHKPRGYTSSISGGISSVQSGGLDRLLPHMDLSGLILVGAIEEDSSGLVMLTNERGAVPDLVKPDNTHVKTWLVDCRGEVTHKQLLLLRKGAQLDDIKDGWKAAVDLIGCGKTQISAKEVGMMTRLEIRLRDSRHHVIRRLCEGADVSLIRMQRMAFGPVLLGKLRPGQHRRLTQKEIKALKRGVSNRTATSSSSTRVGK